MDIENGNTKEEEVFKEQRKSLLHQDTGNLDEDDMFNPKSSSPSSQKMLQLFLNLAIPAIITNFIGFAVVVTNGVFAGHTNDSTMIAVVGLSGVCCNILVLSLMIGINSAQETLTSQAFGAGNLQLCGVYLNRGIFVLTAFFIPLAIIVMFFTEEILLALGQDPEVSRLTEIQVRAQLPSVFFYSQYDLYKRWLSCQRITFVPMVAMVVTAFIHIPLCMLFMHGFQMGIIGIAIATSIKNAVLLLTVMVYGYCSKQIRKALIPIDMESFRGWKQYLQVSLPTTVMLCSEWWAFEVIAILAGTIGVNELAAQTICFSIKATLFMVPLGIQEATCGIVGNCIGANNVKLAKQFFSIINKFSLFAVISLCTTLYFARESIVKFYTQEEEVVKIASDVLILISCAFFFDGLQGYLAGPIRAMGLQRKASYIAIICYWIIAIPIGSVLGIRRELGVIGLQTGFAVAVMVQFTSYIVILLTKNWQEVADEAAVRIERDVTELQNSKQKQAQVIPSADDGYVSVQ